MKKYYFIKGKKLKRYCPSCGNLILIEYFLKNNALHRRFYKGKVIIIGEDYKHLRKLWINPKVAIICCRCSEHIFSINKREDPDDIAYMLQ